MAPDGNDIQSEAARRREAERAALRDARLSEALRSNLKRRKAQERGRSASGAQRSGDIVPPDIDP